MQLQEEEQRVQQQQARMAQRRQENPQPTLQGLNSGRPVQRAPQAAQETQQKSNGVSYPYSFRVYICVYNLNYWTLFKDNIK